MIKPDEKIKLDNFKAQYASILGNIRISNEELGRILLEKKNAQDGILSLTERVRSLTEELSALSKQRDEVFASMDAKILTANEREYTAEKNVKLAEQNRLSVLESLAKEEASIRAQISEYTGKIEDLTDEISTMEEYLSSIRGQVFSYEKDLATVRELFSKESAERNRLNSEFDLQKSSKTKEIEDLTKEIERLKKIREEESGKIVLADEHLKQEKAAIARRERDVLVVTRRLQILFEELKPGTKLKI